MNETEKIASTWLLKTPRLDLTPAGLTEAAAVQAFFERNREFHAPWDPVRGDEFFTLEAVTALLAKQMEQSLQRSAYYWYLHPLGEPVVNGYVGLTNIVYGPFLSAFLGYKLDGGYTSCGYMTEALQSVVAFAFNHCALHRVEANVMPRNLASIRVLEKLGFKNEGYSEAYLRIAGKWEGHFHYALLNPEV